MVRGLFALLSLFSALKVDFGGPLFAPKIDVDPLSFDFSKGLAVDADSSNHRLHVRGGSGSKHSLAWGLFTDDISSVGWSELSIETSAKHGASDAVSYSAGLLEGIATAPHISHFFSNFYQLASRDDSAKKAITNIRTELRESFKFILKQTNFHLGVLSVPPNDPYWVHIRHLLLQLWGIMDGYNAMAESAKVKKLTMVDMLLLNSHGQIGEMMQAFVPEIVKKRRQYGNGHDLKNSTFIQHKPDSSDGKESLSVSPWALLYNSWSEDGQLPPLELGHCSAFVRVTKDFQNLIVGHSTWDDYSKMLRVFKYHKFEHLSTLWASAPTIGFSSYPGTISSADEFYVLSSGLSVMSTSLEILNLNLYLQVPESPSNTRVPDFLHVMTVNRMARTASHWAQLLSESNSGVHSAQWLIVDFNRFEKGGSSLPTGTIFLVEQIPGMTMKEDISQFVVKNNGYFASFDRPWFPDTRRFSGHQEAEIRHGPLYSYDLSPRGQIFAHAAPAVESLGEARRLIRRNTVPREGVPMEDLSNVVAARFDLTGFQPIPNGAIDGKVTDYCLMKKGLMVQAISGPTHDSQSVFSWVVDGVEKFPGWPRLGLPEAFNYSWVQMTPSGILREKGTRNASVVLSDSCPK